MRHDEDLDQTEETSEADDELGRPEAEGASGLVGFVGGLVLGAMIGAGIALLIAPERGKTLRRRLARRLRSAGEDLRGEVDDVRESARRALARRRRRLRRRGLGREVS